MPRTYFDDFTKLTLPKMAQAIADITYGYKETKGADVKIMDRFFRHREVPDSENFSKPGFQLKKASFFGVFVGRTGPRPAGERKQVV